MKGSDQCALMAELAAAETTVSHGENQKGLRRDVGATLMGVREGRDGRDGGGWGEVLSVVLSCFVFIDKRIATRWKTGEKKLRTVIITKLVFHMYIYIVQYTVLVW